MTNVGKDNKRDNVREMPKRSRRDDFGRAVAKIAVAQICQSVGFQGFRDSALECFADIAIRYLCELGKTSNFYANLAGRTECNAFDVIQALEDLGMAQGFPGASKINRCLASSGAVREISEYVESIEVPFIRPILRFPVPKHPRPALRFFAKGETPMGKHVPGWLPALPDVEMQVSNERAADPRIDKTEQVSRPKEEERSLPGLQQRLVSSSPTTNLASANHGNAAGWPVPVKTVDKARIEDNPFLAMPFQFGRKDVSRLALPKLANEVVVENHVSVLEAFGPVIEALKGGVSDPANDERMILPEKRSSIHFKFRASKKFMGESIDLGLRDKAAGKTTLFTPRNDEKDDKKRRAELILRQSMENPQELTQL